MAKTELPEIYSEKPEVPKVEAPVEITSRSDAVVVKKKPLGKKIFEFFFNGDIRDVKAYLINDVVVPAIKETIYDMVTKGFDMLLFNSVGVSPNVKDKHKTVVSYDKKYYTSDRSSRQHRVEHSRQNIISTDDDELIFTQRGPAEKVLSKMVDVLEKYPYVTKEDRASIIEEVLPDVHIPTKFTDNNWGWDNLSRASVDRVRGGYLLNLPAPVHID